MKIGSVTALFGDGTKRERKENPERKKDEPEADSEAFEREADAASVGTAIASFGQEPTTVANGLSAEVVGQGPGLRVTLKDGRGAVVRQFTGEEFIRLREAAAGTGRGKLLDKKL